MAVRLSGGGTADAAGGATDRVGGGRFLDEGKAERLRSGGELMRQAGGGRGDKAWREEDDGRRGGSPYGLIARQVVP
jgi:hypothetical protein